MRGLLAALLLVTACAPGVSELPLAPQPEAFEGGPWAVEFRLDLEPGFWVEGHHTYQLWVDCEALGPRQWSQRTFDALADVDVLDRVVFLRLNGLSVHQTGPSEIREISLDQPTVAVVTILGMAADHAERVSEECVGELRLENGEVLPMEPGNPFRV